MLKNQPILSIFAFILLSVELFAQSFEADVYVRPAEPVFNDTTIIRTSIPQTAAETVVFPEDSTSSEEGDFKPDANKVLWLGAVIPGFGQIINKKYWKLPIIYGGFMGCAYAITWFSGEYQSYKIAYRDIQDGDPTTNSHLNLIPEGMTAAQIFGSETAFAARLKSYQDDYRRYRDLSILISVIYYGLTILEAYVDAQLYDYDISPDLTMRFQPTIINNDVVHTRNINEYDAFAQTKVLGSSNAIGFQWSIRLK